MLLTAETVLTGRELLRPGWIEVSERRRRNGRRGCTATAGGPRSRRGDRGPRLRRHSRARWGRDELLRRCALGYRHGRRLPSQARDDHARRLIGHRRPGRVTAPGSGIGRRRRRRPDRRDPPGRSLAVHAPMRGACAVADAGSRPCRDRARARSRRRVPPHGHHCAGTRRGTGGDRAARRCGCGGRGGAHGGDVRADAGGDCGGSDGGHPPVQRDAPDQHPRAGARR